MSDKIEIMQRNLTFWAHLNEEEKKLLIENAHPDKFKRGDLIHGGDTDCMGILVIQSGCIRTSILSEDGREITLYRLSDGDVCVMTSSCVLSNITFDVQVEADADCEVLVIRSEIYSKLAESNIYVENFTNKEAVSRFSDVMWAMQQILFMSFDVRLAGFLLDEVSRRGKLEIDLTHEQIAKYIGSAREVVSRMLKYFASEGIVTLHRGVIKIIDKNRLYKIVGNY